MSSQDELCMAVKEVLNASKTDRGGYVGYTPYHVIEAMRFMRDRPVGRHQLIQGLNIGEASAKTLIKRLRSNNIIMSSKTGHILTEKGTFILDKITSIYSISHIEGVWIPGFREPVVIASNYINPPVNIVDVYNIRDQIIIYKCSKVVIGSIIENELLFPGIPGDLSDTITSNLKFIKNLVNYATLIIIEKECIPNTINAILHIINNKCNK